MNIYLSLAKYESVKISLQDLRPVCRKECDMVNSILFSICTFKFAIHAKKFKVDAW